jgi:prolyl-tRNA synthetase
MRFSQLFTKTRKEAPKDETAQNAKLLIRAGFIHKEMAGVYTYLPLGLIVLRKIENIIREEMNAIGGQEILMTTLQSPEVWERSGRWSDDVVDNWFKTKLVSGQELGIANTHEEPLTNLLTHFINSHKDLPAYIYQFQTKFRNELRAKSGIMRAREFIMKDMYSFSRNEEEFREFYERCATSYLRIFERVGIGHLTYRTAAAGGSFTTELTDEFQTLSEAGEDIIYLDKDSRLALNKEVYNDENIAKLGLNREKLEEHKSIEVGNIFPLGVKYAEAMGLVYSNESGEKLPPFMGCYGIGLGRLMGTVAEVMSDDKGIIWPAEIAPAKAHLIRITNNESEIMEKADEAYEYLGKAGVEVLYDDREDVSAGRKFADADLIGVPYRVVVSEKTVAEGSVEIKGRRGEAKLVNLDELIRLLKE